VRVRAKKLVAFCAAGSSTALRAADELGVARFFWGKEFQFAYI
jgi:N-methylhydantoinase A/oxoprolinase/acetone carboxylase beta subunit